jgi:hypothetical protein
MGDEVERCRGARGEHDLVGRCGIEEARHALPRLLVGEVGGLGQAIGAAHTLARRPVSWRTTASSAARWIWAVAALSR